jgi:chromosome partitioning protein
MTQIIVCAAIKGGTGKTTTCAAIAQAAQVDGKKVLAIDLDPQANFTTALDGNPNQSGSYTFLSGAKAAETIQATSQGIDCIAGSSDLADIHTQKGSAKRLQNAIEPIKNSYDLIVIDTPPTMGELLNIALYAATDLLIPIEPDPDSLQGLYHVLDIGKHMQQLNTDLKVRGVVLTRYDNRPKINRFYRDTIAQAVTAAGTKVMATIRQGIAIKEARATRQNLFLFAPDSNPAKDYQSLYRTVINQI